MEKEGVIGIICVLIIIVIGIIVGINLVNNQEENGTEGDSEEDYGDTYEGDYDEDDNPYEGEEGDPPPPDKNEDSAGEFKIRCDDAWDCIRPGENTTTSWSFSIPGNDTENIAWTIEGPGVSISGDGASAECETDDSIEEGDRWVYTCKGTYEGKTVESKYYLYCIDYWVCAKEIPGFEIVALVGLIAVCSILVIHRFHKIFRRVSKN